MKFSFAETLAEQSSIKSSGKNTCLPDSQNMISMYVLIRYITRKKVALC